MIQILNFTPLFVEFKLHLRWLKLSVTPVMVTTCEGGQGQPLVVEPRHLIPHQQKRRTLKWVGLETLFLTLVGSPVATMS